MAADIASAVGLVFTVEALWWIVVGYSLGSLLGAIPGLTGIVGIALLLPMSFQLDPWVAIPMLVAIGKGSAFGGVIPAVLLNTPGTPATAATCIDGYQLARRGQHGKALRAALYAGLIGDVFSDLVLIFSAAFLAKLALTFGPAEYTTLMVFALTVVGAVSADAALKGIVGAAAGVFLSMIGMDMITGVSRMTFGSLELSDGLSMIPLMIGLLAMSEIFLKAEPLIARRSDPADRHEASIPAAATPEDGRLSWAEMRSIGRATAIGSLIGTAIGILPGIGQSVAAFVGYGEAKRFSRRPEAFGRGSLEGVAAPEAAAAAVNGANMVPLLALGIPGDVIAAVLLGALMIQGLAPGPLLFEQQAVTVYAIFAGLMLTNVVHWPIGLLFIRLSGGLTRIRLATMLPFIFLLSVVGTYSINNSLFDVTVLIVAGIAGALMRKGGFPPVTVVIGFVLGPLLENSARQALLLSQGSYATFLTHPIALLFLALSLASVLGSLVASRRRARTARP